jgi:hypothetical protein
MNDSASVTWHVANDSSSDQLETLYAWTHVEVPILNVKLSPEAGFAAVQKILPQEQYENSSVGFFDTETWNLRWRCKVRMPPGGNVIHRVEILFVAEERFVLTDVDITMYEREQVVWAAAVSIPSWPTEWPHRPEYEPWEIVGSGKPTLESGSLFVPVHWARMMEPAGWNGGAWQDRYAVEVVRIEDGKWIRRVDDGKAPLTPGSVSVEIEDGCARCMVGSNLLATIVPPTGRRITAADVSLRARRALVVLDARQLVYLALPPE